MSEEHDEGDQPAEMVNIDGPGNLDNLGKAMLRSMSSRLILVSGLPASGKTTLAKALAAELGFVHVERDGLRRAMLELDEALAPDQKGLTGNALNALVNAILGAVADAGQGAVVDANFNNIWQANAVRQFVALRRPRCFEVCLWADPDVLRRRFVERDDPPLTDALRPYFETVLLRDRTPVLGPPVPTAEFDTSEFATLDASRRTLVAQIRAALDL